jgi:hypothetical protein
LFQIVTTDHQNDVRGIPLIARMKAVDLVLDLLPECVEAVQLNVMRRLVDLLNLPANLRLWRSHYKLDFVLDLTLLFPVALRQPIFRIINFYVDSLSSDEVVTMFSFVAFDKRKNLDIKRELLDSLLRNAVCHCCEIHLHICS